MTEISKKIAKAIAEVEKIEAQHNAEMIDFALSVCEIIESEPMITSAKKLVIMRRVLNKLDTVANIDHDERVTRLWEDVNHD